MITRWVKTREENRQGSGGMDLRPKEISTMIRRALSALRQPAGPVCIIVCVALVTSGCGSKSTEALDGGNRDTRSDLTPQGWAVSAGGSGEDEGGGVAVDKAGNSYIAGSFDGTATFGSITLISQGADDVFVAKLSPGGKFLWAVSAGGASLDWVAGIALDSVGNSYITGLFRDSATYGSTSIGSKGSDSAFIAKLSPDGKFLWAVSAEGSHGTGIAADNAGNSYVAGTYSGTTTFGTATFTSKGFGDVFVTKLSSSGTFMWTVTAGGSSAEYGAGIAADSAGNSYVTGRFAETAAFGSTILTTKLLGDAFFAKLNSSGEFQWAASTRGGSGARGLEVALDSSGNSHVMGVYQGTATFGTATLTDKGVRDLFVAKLNPSGAFLWAVSAGGSSEDCYGADWMMA